MLCVCSTPRTHPTIIESFANARISFRQGHSDSLNNPLEECKVSVKIVKNLRVWDEPVDRTLELARNSNVHCTPFCEWAGCVHGTISIYPTNPLPNGKLMSRSKTNGCQKETIDILYQRRAKKKKLCASPKYVPG